MFIEPSWLTFTIWAVAVLMLASANIINLRTIKAQRKTITRLRGEAHVYQALATAYRRHYGPLDERDKK
jgi:hypothetical protein